MSRARAVPSVGWLQCSRSPERDRCPAELQKGIGVWCVSPWLHAHPIPLAVTGKGRKGLLGVEVVFGGKVPLGDVGTGGVVAWRGRHRVPSHLGAAFGWEVQSSLMLGENSYPQVGTGLGAVPGAGATWVLVQGTHGVGIGSTEKWASGGHSAIRGGGSSPGSMPWPKEGAERREKRGREKGGEGGG